jgi:hypothetical protein
LKLELSQLKQNFEDIKAKNGSLLTKYEQDDVSKFRVKHDRLLSRYNELTSRLLMRGDNIDEALQTVDDYDGQLQTFAQWLYKIEQDLNYLEDYCLNSDDTKDATKQTVIELYQVSSCFFFSFFFLHFSPKFPWDYLRYSALY